MPVLEQQRVRACERSVIILVPTRTRARETRSPDGLPGARRWLARAPACPWRYPTRRCAMREKIFFTGPVGKCDACSRPLADEFGFGDVALRVADDLWGLLCLPCYAVDGVRWEWG